MFRDFTKCRESLPRFVTIQTSELKLVNLRTSAVNWRNLHALGMAHQKIKLKTFLGYNFTASNRSSDAATLS